ncbi:reverse transcriptase domain-containing protein [Trichonephila clavipes]|nr:reverse transcriptase domain-containing protein [Trichonephila clavipes]
MYCCTLGPHREVSFLLLGHKFQLITGNYTTAYVVAKSAVNRKFARYLDLAQFDFTTVHRPRKQNVIADHLSRFPTPPVCFTVTASHLNQKSVQKQKQDDFCQYIFRLLKEQNPNKRLCQSYPIYTIDNNTLVRVKEKSKSFAL